MPREVFYQNLWKISLKKFVFRKDALSRSRKFLPKKETGEKHNFHNFFIGQKPQEMWLKVADCQPATLLEMSFFIGIFERFWLQISEHLFSRTPLKWLLLQWRIPDLDKMELFCEYNDLLKAVNYFHKKAPSQMFHKVLCMPLFWGYKFYLSNVQVQSLL